MCAIKSSVTVVLSVGLFFCAFAGDTRTIEGHVLTYDIPLGETYVENELIPLLSHRRDRILSLIGSYGIITAVSPSMGNLTLFTKIIPPPFLATIANADII